jgi:hypothetical protein
MADALRRIYFGAYGLAAAGMAISDTFFGAKVSAQTGWGHAQGWMTEMACFDVLVAFLCVRALFEPALTRVIATGLVLLSFLLASHNLVAYFENHAPAHLQGGLMHVVACVVGIIVARSAAVARQ